MEPPIRGCVHLPFVEANFLLLILLVQSVLINQVGSWICFPFWQPSQPPSQHLFSYDVVLKYWTFLYYCNGRWLSYVNFSYGMFRQRGPYIGGSEIHQFVINSVGEMYQCFS
jgi:hypothetical protein